ncbi:uncharacterized protein LOC125943040 [Dermacentor silvarum]|uniref:uncharacterized protein LOC125943040 n=1 Tax=Dermacentor silvarum TaxID=543639 RepID=UPI0021007907|nr:uncharacterized protein LOC125943040 [Dermacentor silvarum]
MAEQGRHANLLRIVGHDVVGVNWRPTRLAEDVPQSRICGLCGVLPKSTVVLPCSHFLCELCLRASVQDGGCLCPLDREPFDEEECERIRLPARKANSLKAHCWNEAQGCEFTDTMESLLHHYEKDCIFHAVECQRCEEKILQQNLPAHYLAGCAVPAGTQQPTSHGGHLTVDELNAALAELKVHISESWAELQYRSRVNELFQQSRSQGLQLVEMTRTLEVCERDLKSVMQQVSESLTSVVSRDHNELAEKLESHTEQLLRKVKDCEDGLKGEMERIANSVAEKVHREFESRQHPIAHRSRRDSAPEVRRGGAFQGASGSGTSLPSCKEQAIILRKLEVFASVSLTALEHLRQCAPSYARRPAAYCERLPNFLHFFPDETLATSRRDGIEENRFVTYRLTIKNADQLFTYRDRPSAQVLRWHRTDACLSFAVRAMSTSDALLVAVSCTGFLRASRLLSPVTSVTMLHEDPEKNCVLEKYFAEQNSNSDRLFKTGVTQTRDTGFIRDGELKFDVVVVDE